MARFVQKAEPAKGVAPQRERKSRAPNRKFAISFDEKENRKMEHILSAENLVLKLSPNIFEKDIAYPINTVMTISLQSDGFAVNTAMDIDVKELSAFTADLCRIYETLSGEARIEEAYGMHMYLSFSGDGRGHIGIKGYLHGGNRRENEYFLEFQQRIDQTCLKDFCYDLQKAYSRYPQC